jgi:hypothetical protein
MKERDDAYNGSIMAVFLLRLFMLKSSLAVLLTELYQADVSRHFDAEDWPIFSIREKIFPNPTPRNQVQYIALASRPMPKQKTTVYPQEIHIHRSQCTGRPRLGYLRMVFQSEWT